MTDAVHLYCRKIYTGINVKVELVFHRFTVGHLKVLAPYVVNRVTCETSEKTLVFLVLYSAVVKVKRSDMTNYSTVGYKTGQKKKMSCDI